MTFAARSDFVVDLSQLGAQDLDHGGGKAANLGELLRAGFPVPAGFVITTAAYDRVVESNNLQFDIEKAPDLDAAVIRAGFAQATIPPALERAILEAYRHLGGGPVAVRSSATAEDLPEAAFAGQQESFLGVSSDHALLAAVRRCWASLWTDRVVSYREQHGLSRVTVKLAVVVQRMVAADVAGVMFTANPVTGARNETIIEASAGLGEALVGGLVTPDRFVLRNTRHRWQIVEQHPGRREVEIRQRSGGVEPVAGAATPGPLLPDAVLLQLARMGASIAKHLARPQDVEWAWADRKLFILQSRPITALPQPPARPRRFQPQRFAGDYLQVRPYPLDMTTWLPAVANALPRMLPVSGLIPSFARMWIENDGVVERIADHPGMRPTPELLLAPVRIIALARRYDPAKWRDDPILTALLATVHELESRDLQALTWSELLDTAREVMAMPLAVMEIRRRYFPRGALALAALWIILAVLNMRDRFALLLSGVDNLTLDANRALEALTVEIRNDSELASLFASLDSQHLLSALRHETAHGAFLERFTAFLDAYGHRETGSPLLVSQPTWKDSPQTVLGILQGMARAESTTRPGHTTWMTARDEVLAHPALRWLPVRRFILDLIMQARRLSALREDTHFAMTLPMPVLRRTLLELGRRLAEASILESAEEVFHLRFEELASIEGVWPPPADRAEQLRQAARGRADRRLELERAGTPLMDLPSLSGPQPGGGLLVSGTPGSPGVAEGPVRVVRDPEGFGSLRPGEVLVAPYTNPSWTPLFISASAVVVDTGAAMSHAAIVAREYGVPAVMGTGDGTRRLRDGQWVRVDGSRGQVFAVSVPGEDSSSRVAVGADRENQLPERR